MQQWMDFVRPELLILVPVLYFVGEILKKSNLNNKWIPLFLGGTGIAFSLLYVFGTGVWREGNILSGIFTALTQGILTAGASVYANQIIKQMKPKG